MAISPRVLTLLDAETGVVTGTTINNISVQNGYTVQVAGTFVGTVTIQGSFDGTMWTDIVSKTAEEMFNVDFAMPYIRGKVTAYTSGTINCYAMSR